MRHALSTTWRLGRKPKVCVIGAGFSGLVCAERLGKQGMDVSIVEARDRVGGRVHQVNSVGHWTDMGANWIHGAHINPIRDLAKKVGAVTLELEEVTRLYDEDGQPMSESHAAKLEEVVWGILADAYKYSNEHEDIPVNMSLYDYIVQQLEGKNLSVDDKRAVLQMSEMWGDYVGSPLDRQSLKYLFLEASLEGENAFIASTYRDILNYVEAQALKQAALYLESEITSIDTNAISDREHSISIAIRQPEHRVRNMPSLRPYSNYDAVVVTVPVGCLKDHAISFKPELPQRLDHAINSIGYGNLEKVYIRFPRAFWHKPEQPFPLFSHFLHPKYTSRNLNHWDIALTSLASVPKQSARASHPTLLFYIYGPCARHMTNLITDLQPSDPEYRTRLVDFFEPYYSRLPGYEADEPDCEPAALLATDWEHDRLAGRGSYTNWQIDDNDKHGLPAKMPLDDAIRTLREGMPDRAVWFAGEHTAPFTALGTVTGAYLSGEEVAERIVGHFSTDETGGNGNGSAEGAERRC